MKTVDKKKNEIMKVHKPIHYFIISLFQSFNLPQASK